MESMTNILRLGLVALFICAACSSGKNDFKSASADLDNDSKQTLNPEDRLKEYMSSPSLDYEEDGKVVLSICKELYNDKLVPVHWVTVANNTSRPIKGIEVRLSYDQKAFTYKIVLGPHSSRKLQTNKFDCNSDIVGIIFSNGEYKNMRSFDEQSGIKESDRMDYQKH